MLYKLTDRHGMTRAGSPNACKWGENITHSGTGEGPLCSEGWVHAYTSPLLAVLLNPVHANIQSPRLWEAEGEIGLSNSGLKVGCQSLTTIAEIEVPQISAPQRTAFGILCAKEVCPAPEWVAWADGWLRGEDRTQTAARAAAAAVEWAAAVAWAWAAAAWADEAARAAATAAEAAAEEAAAAWAAWAAAKAAGLDLPALAQQAMTYR